MPHRRVILRLIFSPLALAVLCLLGSAPALRATVELDIPVFAGGNGTDFYVESARAFEQVRKDIRVHVYGDPRIQDQVRVRVIDGHYPDAASVAYILWPTLARAGKILPLESALDSSNWEGDTPWRRTFLPGAIDTWRIDGKVYGLPVSYACWTLFYNKALFREHGWTIPRTWDEFFSLCSSIKAAGVAPVSLPGTRWLYPDAFLRAAYYNLAGREGWEALNHLAPGARQDPRYLRAAALEQKILQEDTLRGWQGETHTGAERAFFEGRSAMTVTGSWLVNEMAGKIPRDFELGAMNFPVFTDGVADPTTIQGQSDCFFVFHTGNPEREKATIEFLKFLTSRERSRAFVRELDSPSAVKGVPVADFSPRMQDTARLIEAARGAFGMTQTMLQPPALRQALIDESERLTQGVITPEEFGRRLENAAAEDRAQASQPGFLELRHPWAGSLFLLFLTAAVAWLAWSAAQSRRQGARPQSREDYFGKLRLVPGLGFIGPSLLLYAGLVVGPAVAAFTWAFTRWDGIGTQTWSGLFNFKSLLFGNDLFWLALEHNVFLMLVPAVVVVPLALVCASLLHRGVWGGSVFRVVFLFPNMLGGIAATLLWLNAYEPRGGLVNAGLVAVGRAFHIPALVAMDGYPWLSPEHLYFALIPIYLWMACGFNLILYLAAMEGIDPQLYEAASLDGASPVRQFFMITLPMIREVVAISIVFLVISGLNAFEMVWLLTSQDPSSSTHTLGTLLVVTLFKDFEIGRATALAVILFALVFACSATVLRLMRKDSEEAS